LVCIILLNWNGCRDTTHCLESLQRLTYSHYRVIVVDNGSTDDSVRCIREKYLDLEIIENGKNLGFAAGCNVAIRRALDEGTDYVWLLNNDTVVHPDSLSAMVECAQGDPIIGAVGSVIYRMDQPEKVDAWGGGRVSLWTGRSSHITGPQDLPKLDYITGASLLISRLALESVGLLDERFFLYYDDCDYSLRLRGTGWKLAVAGPSRIWHKVNATLGKRREGLDWHIARSGVLLVRKHAVVPVVAESLLVCLRLGKRLLERDWQCVRAVLSGALSARRG
jgi:GT2 family glycosyltransferase